MLFWDFVEDTTQICWQKKFGNFGVWCYNGKLAHRWEKSFLVLGCLLRMWRNWYTRTFEGRVALPCEFESRHPHFT